MSAFPLTFEPLGGTTARVTLADGTTAVLDLRPQLEEEHAWFQIDHEELFRCFTLLDDASVFWLLDTPNEVGIPGCELAYLVRLAAGQISPR